MSSQPNSIDARVVLVTDANGSLTRSASGGRPTATRNARPLFATIANAGADEPSAGFGDLVRDHRRAAGLTQEQLAERAGVSQRSISNMERGGEHVPRRDTVTLLVRALGLSRPEREVFEGLVERSRRRRPVLDRLAIDQAALIPARVFERPTHNLPRSLTRLVGREQELAELDRVLPTAPLLTLVGAGGVGKTRLAQELVRNHVASYPDGSWLIELARLTDASLIPSAVAAAVGLHDLDARNVTSTLAEYLRPLKLLLVLDNCEHLVEACAELVATLLRTCPDLQVVATSREPLAIAGEVTWRVPPLGLPEPYTHSSPEQIMLSAAVRLFIERAQAVSNALVLTPENLQQVARICIGVDGIPLALELAAAHARVLPVEQLADRLEYDSEVLGRTIRTGPPQHQTMRATLDWSHQLLGDQERALMRRLSVFARGWTLRFAEVVCSGAGINAAHVLGLLTRLVDKSMVLVDATDAVGRYRFLGPIRHYALERLEASGEATRYWARHAAASRYFAQIGEAEPVEPTEISSRDQLESEHAGLRIALRWELTSQDSAAALRCMSALFHVWKLRGHLQAGCASVQQALASSDDGPALYRGRALNAQTDLYCRCADVDSAQPIAC
jgi:predicted ATPase/DNA-binding XRE family transcriptional regulator